MYLVSLFQDQNRIKKCPPIKTWFTLFKPIVSNCRNIIVVKKDLEENHYNVLTLCEVEVYGEFVFSFLCSVKKGQFVGLFMFHIIYSNT